MITESPVRKATWEDRDQIHPMCMDGYAEQNVFKPSPMKIEGMLAKAFDAKGAILGAIGPVGAVQGIIYLDIGQFCFTEDWCLEEVFSYVSPPYRKTPTRMQSPAKAMIEFGKRCADELHIPLVIGVVSNERTIAKMELYRRQLGNPVGGYFIHQPASAGLNVA